MNEVTELTKALLRAKKAKGMTFADLEPVLNCDEVWIAALFYGQASATEEQAGQLAEALGLSPDIAAQMTEFPLKGLGPMVPTDPFVYRFYEIAQVYGLPLKAVVQEKFGDGIVSAVDFSMNVERQEDPRGDRVVITLNGKFLPYKTW